MNTFSTAFKNLLLITSFAIFIVLSGCNSEPQEYELLGKWKLVNVESGTNLGNAAIAVGLTSMDNPIFEFRMDKTVTIISNNGQGESNITLSHNFRLKNGKIVSVKENGMENEMFNVNLSNDTLYLDGNKGFKITLTRP